MLEMLAAECLMRAWFMAYGLSRWLRAHCQGWSAPPAQRPQAPGTGRPPLAINHGQSCILHECWFQFGVCLESVWGDFEIGMGSSVLNCFSNQFKAGFGVCLRSVWTKLGYAVDSFRGIGYERSSHHRRAYSLTKRHREEQTALFHQSCSFFGFQRICYCQGAEQML